jgi:hypothetical protein
MSDPMTPEAKAAVMALMGTTYGEMKKQDDMIINPSQQLSHKSGEMQNLVKNLINIPTVNAPPKRGYDGNMQAAPQQPAPQQAPAPVAPAPVTPEQAMAELKQAPPVAPAPVVEETMEFDFSEPSQMDQLLAAVKESNLLLKDIKLQLENSNVRPNRKSVKSKVAG